MASHPRSAPDIVDAVIIGGGPAGATAGRLLASWGHSVSIVNRDSTRPVCGETLPPSTVRLLRQLGIQEQIESAGFFQTTGNTVWWGTKEPRVETYPEPGYQVSRSQFDRVLLTLARSAGVDVLTDSVEHVELAETALVRLRSGRQLRARFALDCSGRTGVIARQGFRINEPGFATVAISGAWTTVRPWPIADPSHTLIESYEDGWAWSIPLSHTRRFVTVMINVRETRTARGAGLLKIYFAELGKTAAFRQMLEASELEGAPSACDASLYHARAYSGPQFLLAGDAGAAVDPLSSFGIKKALSSGWLAAVVVNTCLLRPAIRPAATGYFDECEGQVYRNQLRQTAALFRESAHTHANSFWTSRSAAPAEAEFCSRPELASALKQLQRSPAIQLRRGPQVRIALAPRVRGREVVLEDSLLLNGLPEYLCGVHLPKLIEIADQYNQVPDLFAAYNCASDPVALPNFLSALCALLARGGLVDDLVAGPSEAPFLPFAIDTV